MISSDWQSQIFEKKIVTQFLAQSGLQWGFPLEFSILSSLDFLEILYNYSLQQCLASNRGKTVGKKIGVPNLGQN